jgi:hypothetical protein
MHRLPTTHLPIDTPLKRLAPGACPCSRQQRSRLAYLSPNWPCRAEMAKKTILREVVNHLHLKHAHIVELREVLQQTVFSQPALALHPQALQSSNLPVLL